MTAGSLLFALGAALFLLLGSMHAWLTLKDERRPRTFAPRDPALLDGMMTASPRISADTTLWRAGLGFHYSHSLGAIGFGLLYGGLALFAWPILTGLPVLLWAAPAVASIYLVLAARYWFRVPLMGAGLGCLLFLAGAIASTVSA